VLSQKIADSAIILSAMAPRANYSLFEDANGKVHFWHIDNEHPEISFSALWQEVWYEGYSEPDYIWQSSAANNDFEPKYSLSPLAFGTLKAAFYAMLVATPLAICGALYTAYFMAPALRRKVKPSIELMEALPTVILGFLAGLFFAPFMEAHLPGIFTWLLLTPLALITFGFMWVNLPERIRHLIPEGWDPVLLIPVIILSTWLSIELSPILEVSFFGGDMRSWLSNDMGIDFDQRNALVVGAAMGFAVIPTIFSITEDAIFSVPKHLSYGSLALGATQWQTMTRVVLPTASPGIFSAVMIGMGRAVGETMIVLMATGNTPIMDMNIFEGMRTLSANIAVEMPESEVGSTHFRILFLAAFVLFVFTFVVNTIAEYVRQSLRSKYSVI
jgi:phosphate transport system permease protein